MRLVPNHYGAIPAPADVLAKHLPQAHLLKRARLALRTDFVPRDVDQIAFTENISAFHAKEMRLRWFGTRMHGFQSGMGAWR